MRKYAPILIALCAAAALVAAFFFADLDLVWRRAAHICFECVGIG